jgi:hypothetical protein
MKRTIIIVATLIVASFLFSSLMLSGCGGGGSGKEGSKVVNNYLDNLEKKVAQWETKAQSSSFTLTDLAEMNKASVDDIGEGKRLQGSEVWNSDQQKRYDSLCSRFSKTLMEMSAKPSGQK